MKSGDYDTGERRAGRLHGRGVLTRKDGSKVEGIWRQGKYLSPAEKQ